MSVPFLPWCGVAPRIDSARFPRYRGRSARVPGQIIEDKGSSVMLRTVDGGVIEVYVPDDIDLSRERDVEITGKILGEDTMECWWFISYAYSIDNRVLRAAIHMLHDSLFVGPVWGIQFDPPQHVTPLRVPLMDESRTRMMSRPNTPPFPNYLRVRAQSVPTDGA
ncbi:hypothetical protein PUNSTDRAFT_135216 [Punctularia strigosozonata HHB-11173 SS5]|uniref:uncharacterized protein n=1 Tax=Punctularia strigosozonata (strain HHB-11173) TaxID=741275 RepID=UPI00044182FD|nr:uncharacterized protein PUNSTDRAFT_135216 [Punctularia strigosozonata HHB-11173 SS5]EIN07694.1 hypothetical protein PUNSTDRAFT_135216 [Punctularia strigosozonata HHB-11173 SS5]